MMTKLPINPKTAMTLEKYFNDERNEDVEKCKDATIKNARDKILAMAETINGNIKTSTDMVTTSSKLESLIIEYNKFIKDSSTVKDWSSGHQNILKLTGKYSTLLSNLIKRDQLLKKQCDEKMKQPPQHPLKPILEYFITLEQKTNHFYLPTYVVLKLLRYRDLTFKATKHAEGLQPNITLNTVLQVNGSQRRRETKLKLFKKFFKFITTNFNISIQTNATLNQNIYLPETRKNIEAIDQYIETMESLLKYLTQNDISSTEPLANAELTAFEVETYENIRKHFEFINTRAFALGEYFNFILQKKPGKQVDHLKVSNFRKYINAIRKKLKGGIQSRYNTPSPPSSNGVRSFEDKLINEEIPTQQRQSDKKLRNTIKLPRKSIKGGPPGTSGYAKPPPGISIINVGDLKRDEANRLNSENAKRQGRRPGWSRSSRRNFTEYYRDGDTKRSDMKPTYGPRGGNKTRKKKRKKRNTTRNKKRHKKKKHKTRYKKRKKMKQTRKNK